MIDLINVLVRLFKAVLGMGWPFALLVGAVLLWRFGPKGRLAPLIDAFTVLISRINGAKFGNLVLTMEERRELEESASRTAGATPAKEAVPEPERTLLHILKDGKPYPNASVGDYPYLLHQVESSDHPKWHYRVRVFLEFWHKGPFQQDQVERVYYRVDDTFPENMRVMTSNDASKGFQLLMRLYGEFTVIAVVVLKDGRQIWLTRYLELPGRPPD